MKHFFHSKLPFILIVMIFLGMGCLPAATGEDPDIFQIEVKDEVGEEVVACNPQNQNCITNTVPSDRVYGLVRSGQFAGGEEALCYPLLEDCQEAPPGPLLANVQISLWAYRGDEEPHGGLIHQTIASDDGFYSLDPKSGDYWLTVYDSNHQREPVTDFEKIFGSQTTFHFVEKITISEESTRQHRVYLKDL